MSKILQSNALRNKLFLILMALVCLISKNNAMFNNCDYSKDPQLPVREKVKKLEQQVTTEDRKVVEQDWKQYRLECDDPKAEMLSILGASEAESSHCNTIYFISRMAKPNDIPHLLGMETSFGTKRFIMRRNGSHLLRQLLKTKKSDIEDESYGLLYYGANPYDTDATGLSAFDIAKKHRNLSLLKNAIERVKKTLKSK